MRYGPEQPHETPESRLRGLVKHELLRRCETQEEIAAASGFSQPQLSRWLAGKRRLRSDHLATLLGILGVSIVPEDSELRTLYLGEGLSVIHPSNAGRRF